MLGIVNMLRGVFIFLVFIWKPSIWRATKVTHPRLSDAIAKCARYVLPRDKQTFSPPRPPMSCLGSDCSGCFTGNEKMEGNDAARSQAALSQTLRLFFSFPPFPGAKSY